jgi:hypothetical protein
MSYPTAVIGWVSGTFSVDMTIPVVVDSAMVLFVTMACTTPTTTTVGEHLEADDWSTRRITAVWLNYLTYCTLNTTTHTATDNDFGAAMPCTTTSIRTALTVVVHDADTNECFTLATAAKMRSSLAASGFFSQPLIQADECCVHRVTTACTKACGTPCGPRI